MLNETTETRAAQGLRVVFCHRYEEMSLAP